MRTSYEIDDSCALFEHLIVLLVVLESVCRAVLQLKEPLHEPIRPGEVVGIKSARAGLDVLLPIYGPVHNAIHGHKPDLIRLSTSASADTGEVHAGEGFTAMLNAVAQPFFINYYEQHVHEVRQMHGSDSKSWPMVWQMGWVVRNACAHGGDIDFRDAKRAPAIWRGLAISASDHGKPLFGSEFNAADQILLLLEMEEERAGAKIPTRSVN